MAVVVALALIAASVGIYRYRNASAGTAVPYTTSKAVQGNLAQTVTATGPISAAQAVPLNFKNSGKLAEIDVKVGETVTAGQVLAKLDTADLTASLNQAQANLASAQSAYNKLAQGALPTDVAAAQVAVNAANSQLNDAKSALATAQTVATRDTASAELAVTNAQQSYNDAINNQQALPAVLAQQIESAKDKLYSDQITDDAAVGRGAMTKDQRQAALDVDQVAIDQANASALQQQTQQQATVNQASQALKTAQSNLATTQAKDAQTLQSAQAQVNTAQSSVATAQAAYAAESSGSHASRLRCGQSQHRCPTGGGSTVAE